MSKKLSLAQGIEAACILFEINTECRQILHMALNAKLLPSSPSLPINEDTLCLEWYGFMHAVIVTGLMVHAPNIVLAEYLRTTTAMLAQKGLNKEQCDCFVDNVFSPYVEKLANEKPQECPNIFFQKVCNAVSLENAPPHAVAIISTAMAMAIGAVKDALEQYDIQVGNIIN